MKKITSTLYVIIFILILIIGGSLALSAFNNPLNIRIFTVLSGSMEPAIKTGGIVIIKSQQEYKKGDIVTFRSEKSAKETFTHRITKVNIDPDNNQINYNTKGDANEDQDLQATQASRALGKVILTLPYMGYVVNFAQTQTGLIVLIIIPATIIVYSELLNIKSEILKIVNNKKKKTKK